MLHQQISKNKRKTIGVLVCYAVLFSLIGLGVGYSMFRSPLLGLVLSTVGGGLYAVMMISQSTNIVMRLNHAHEVTDKSQYPMLWHIVEEMSLIAQVPMPKVYVIQDESPNAFATGMSPDKAAVAATTGLLNRLNREELEGVMAHEFAHIKNYDVRLQTIAVALGAVIAIIVQFSGSFYRFGMFSRSSNREENASSNGAAIILMVISFLAMILGPLMATIMQYALSRNREYLADATAVAFTRNPMGLISALEKISSASQMTQADPQSAALYISNPFKKNDEKDSLFSTHPATVNRIKRLREM